MSSIPESRTPNPRSLPRWLKRNVPKGGGHFTVGLIDQLGLQTVCDHAKCPNRMECYSRKTATFMILGDVCTRGCRFCSVNKGRPSPLDPDEPRRVAEAVHRLGLKHVVITCVTRDDLPDGGASHFVRTIEEIRGGRGAGDEGRGEDCLAAASTQRRGEEGRPLQRPLELPTIEVLPSDFSGNAAAVDMLVAAEPDVYNYNTETVPRLFPTVRGCWANGAELFLEKSGATAGLSSSEIPGNTAGQASSGTPSQQAASVMLKHNLHGSYPNYAWTLEIFRRVSRANPSIALKSGMMLGLGETTDELLETWADLLEAGCRMLTLGQYLQPSPAQMPVVSYVPPEEFERLGERARRMGFKQVASGPFVRSSYHAREMLNVPPV